MQIRKIHALVVAAVIVIGLVVYLFLRNSGGVLTAIPKSSVAVVEIRNWQVALGKLNTTLTGAAWKNTDAAQKLTAEIAVMQQMLSADKSLQESITNFTTASVHLVKADDYGFLYTTELAGVNDNTILNRIQASPTVRKVSVRIFKGKKIVEAELKSGKQLSFAKVSNVLAFSFTSFLTENAVTAEVTNQNLQNDKAFKSVYVKNSIADVLVYFNYSKAEVILPVCVKTEKVTLLSDISSLGEWSCFQINLSNEQTEATVTTSGLHEEKATTNTANSFSTLLGSIPDNVAYVNMNLQEPVSSSAMLQGYFSNWVGTVKAFVITEPFNENFSEQNLFAVATVNQSKAVLGLKKLIADNGDSALPVDTFGTNEIYLLKDGSAVQQYFGNTLVTFTQCHFTVTDRAVLFAQSAGTLQLTLEKISKGETLNRDADFLNSGKGNLADCSGMLYLHPQRAVMLCKALLNENSAISGFLAQQKSILQFTKTVNGKTSSTVFIKPGLQQQASAGLLWKTKLLAASLFAPQPISNRASGEEEIFTQDTLHNVYLLNQAGKILFTKNVAEPVRGRVEQVDYYNNGSQQIIFSTSHHIFILDRLGNNIASYPLQLSAETLSGIALLTEGTRSRYYVACVNGNVYGYEVNGKPIAGFSPLSGVGVVENTLQFFTKGSSSFLLAQNKSGYLMLFDKQGKLKWQMENMPATQSFSVVNKMNPVFANASGNQLIRVSLDGNHEIMPLMDSAGFFTAMAVSDTTHVYYFSTHNQLRSYTGNNVFKGAINFNSPVLSLHTKKIGGEQVLIVKTSEALSVFTPDLKKVSDFKSLSITNTCVTKSGMQNRLMAVTPTADGYLACYRLP